MVRSAEDGRLIRVAPQVWENARYTVNEEKGTVETEVQGTFTQVPLRPAWAITIHKSQGLTFERVVIDAGSSFAPGQVYVALSRCRTLEGIVLATPISPSSLYADPAVNTFMDTTTASAAMVMEQLPAMKAAYHRRLLSGLFNFGPVLETLESLQRLMYTNFRSLFPEVCMHVDRAAADATKDLVNTAAKWRTLIEGNADMSDAVFNTRVRRSALFFRSVLVSLFADLVKELGTVKTDNKKAAARRAELTEDLRRTVVMILPDSPSLYIKTGEAEHLFLKRTEILITQMAHEQLLGETRITLLLLYKVHPLVEIVHRDVQRLAKRDRIEPSALLILHHHDIVSRLIINHQLAVAVGNDTTRRVFNLLKESIGVGTLAIIVAHYLQSEQPYDIGDHYNDSHTAYDNTPVIKLKVLHRRLLTFSITSNSTDVTAILPATHSNQ